MKFQPTHSFDRVVESAYILRLSRNPISVEYAERCKLSCDKVNMPVKFWEAVDGTDSKNIIIPDHLAVKSHMKWLKVYKNDISNTQIAIMLSHFSLWCHCLEIDKPIVILEHDAVMIKQLTNFNFYNQIQYLGCHEQLAQTLPIWKIPPHGSWYDGRLRFILRAHAYAIDPAVAKNLVSHIIKVGIITTADVFMRSDLFPIIQEGIYAYDVTENNITTNPSNDIGTINS